MATMLNAVKTAISSYKAVLAGIVGTGGYVIYTDTARYSNMARNFEKGNILSPCIENNYETPYVKRPNLEKQLKFILGPQFSNEYYLVRGEVGSGKSRTIVELVRDMIENEGSKYEGAPIYVLASQGNNFTDTLAKATKFKFDEHINFQFFVRFLMQIEKFPGKDSHNKLTRVLDAIENAAFLYMNKNKKPVVLVIDGANTLTEEFPVALEKLQEKAKLWADTNICKVVFVSNDEKTEQLLQKNSSCWSRIGAPVHVGDLDQSQSIDYLMHSYLLEECVADKTMSENEAIKGYDMVGGRIQHLTLLKRDFARGISLEETRKQMINKEKEKFLRVVHIAEMWNVIDALRNSPDKSLHLVDLAKCTKVDVIVELANLDILRIDRKDGSIMVTFESRITEVTLDDFFAKHEFTLITENNQ